ncbi:MAG: glycosyltransferase family 39 protein [Acidobacteriota bacterium]|nr:glycosyltransferase family 39 protein [Acidobacteriota bacterium]
MTRRFRRVAIVSLIVLFTIATRLPSLVVDRAIDDEAVYSLVANEIIDGGRPYVDAVERKPPLLFWTYAAVFKLAGKYNWRALHVVSVIWTLATMLGLYLIGRQLFDRTTGCWAALLYCIYQPWGTWKNLALNGELLMNLPIVWAWALAFQRGVVGRRTRVIAAGALLCAGFLLKQPAAIAGLPLGLYLLGSGKRRPTWTGFIEALLFTMGFVAALGLVMIILERQGILDEAIFWSIRQHALRYIFWGHASVITFAFVGASLPLLFGGVKGWPLWSAIRAERFAILGWLAVSVIGTAAGGRFYPHYYIQLVPPLALLAAPWFASVWVQDSRLRHRKFSRRSVLAVLGATVVVFFVLHWLGLKSKQPGAAAQYLSEHSIEQDRIFVWGHSASIYLDSHRRPACRYILTFPLTGYLFGESVPNLDTTESIVPGSWDRLQEDFSKHPPVYIVDVESDPDARYPIRDFPTLNSLIAQHYKLVSHGSDYNIYRRR